MFIFFDPAQGGKATESIPCVVSHSKGHYQPKYSTVRKGLVILKMDSMQRILDVFTEDHGKLLAIIVKENEYKQQQKDKQTNSKMGKNHE